ncbi:zinc finger protein 525-like [Acyrthosiphon pisum]|uniref:C2H2-type domain-containing protein n=1 Tax=Acyrthosiphon pisum TaxID=7029 RepID=A0A8R2JL99_ACYPI|nr:zinc finger protein 525-like [Acyrthosiphon pisum]
MAEACFLGPVPRPKSVGESGLIQCYEGGETRLIVSWSLGAFGRKETYALADDLIFFCSSISENEETTIKAEKDLIECFAFEGAVLNESHSSELMQNMESILKEKPLTHNVFYNAFSNLSQVPVDKKFQNGNNHHKCNICDKLYNSKANLTRHVKIHTREESEEPEKKSICAYCNKSYTKSYLKTHTKIHTGQNLHNCDICNKKYCLKSTLTYHKRTHTGVKPYKCDICDSKFSQSSTLTYHKRTHTGVKPFKCDKCDKRFFGQSNLYSHMRTHSCVKIFTCDICDQDFSRKGDLIIHLTTHICVNLYKCDICYHIFKKIKNVKKHVMTFHF